MLYFSKAWLARSTISCCMSSAMSLALRTALRGGWAGVEVVEVAVVAGAWGAAEGEAGADMAGEG